MKYFGIDFGTTNTAVVSIDTDAEFGSQVTYLNEYGDLPFSSIVAIPKEEGNLLFGRKVRDQRHSLAETHEVHTSMKSFLGTQESFVVGGKRYYPKDITTAFLRHIKEHVKNEHNIIIDAASFAFPVDFSPEARRELMEAATNAGIQAKAFVNESTAAYIANRDVCKAFSKVMVLDWGGGTLDISILRLTGTSIHEISVWGDRIGGDDIDRELAERVHGRIASKAGIPGGRFKDMRPEDQDQMIKRCEETKIAISEDGEDYNLSVVNYGKYGMKNETITEAYFDSVAEPIIRSRILKAIDDALGKAGGLSPASIDGVIVVGGSSNLRLFRNAVTNLFRDAQIIVPPNPQWSTAKGAALMQIIGGNFRLSEAVGVKLSDDSVYEILPKGSTINKAIDPVTFSLAEDALDARFIFTDSRGKTIYARESVPVKGFLEEDLVLSARIDSDQIARIHIVNASLGSVNKGRLVELNKLTFHYDISALRAWD